MDNLKVRLLYPDGGTIETFVSPPLPKIIARPQRFNGTEYFVYESEAPEENTFILTDVRILN
jgi:hypothetical protein